MYELAVNLYIIKHCNNDEIFFEWYLFANFAGVVDKCDDKNAKCYDYASSGCCNDYKIDYMTGFNAFMIENCALECGLCAQESLYLNHLSYTSFYIFY